MMIIFYFISYTQCYGRRRTTFVFGVRLLFDVIIIIIIIIIIILRVFNMK